MLLGIRKAEVNGTLLEERSKGEQKRGIKK